MLDLNYLNEYDKVVIGYSGGPDSQALFKLVLDAVSKDKICLVHINHGISENAADWEGFCRDQAESCGVEFHAYQYVMKGISNLESFARDVRYGDFAKHYSESGKTALLTGHHEDDQVETFFLSLMRGAGIDGLACMPVVKKINSVVDHIRPMLSKTKEELVNYLDGIESKYVIDESNAESDYSRNFFRNEIIPQIRKRYPHLNKSISKSVNNIQKAKVDIDHSAMNVSRVSSGDKSRSIKLSFKESLDLELISHRKAVISTLKRRGITIGHDVLDEVQKTLFTGESKSGYAMVEFDGYVITGNSSVFYVVERDFYFSNDYYSKGFENGVKLQNSDYVLSNGRKLRFKKFCESRKVPLWIKSKIRGIKIENNEGINLYRYDEDVLNELKDF